jgi:deoxyadenosine/deoxycytidine kinase
MATTLMTTTMPTVISIEGNIGSGKSTLLNKLRNKYKDDPTIGFVDEPIQLWNTIKDTNGVTILENYYTNQNKYAFPFQMMAYISRLSILRKALKCNYRVIIMERSIYTDAAVFAKMLYDDRKIEEIEYSIYTKWFDEFIDDLPPIHFIYVRAEPSISLTRVIHRSRQGEETIPLEYLENCHKYHEEWLDQNQMNKSNTLLVLNANTDINNNGLIYTYIDAIDQKFINK